MLTVLLTRHPSSHGYYTELVAAPPPGVTFRWRDEAPAGPAGGSALKAVAGLLLAALCLPNVRRVAVPGGAIDLLHSGQHLLVTRHPWVVDIEHACPFVGIRFGQLRRRFTRRVIRRVLASGACRGILPWTETAAEGFLRTFGGDSVLRRKVRVVYPAVRAPEERRSRHDDGECRVLFAANAPAWNVVIKGGRELVEAIRILRSKGRKVRLTVVGPIPPALATEWAAVEGVLLLGRVSRTELYRQYSESDVYAMPSFSDTFGMAFVEAMAFGLPVVALDRPYTREIVRDGETGLLVKLGDSSVAWCDAWGGFTMDSDAFIRCVLDADVDVTVVAQLVEQLDRLVDDPALRRRLGDRGREEVLDGRFSVTRRNATLEEVYSRAARGCDQ